MLYARELIDLMGAYPGREFKLIELCRYVSAGKTLDTKQRRAMQRAIQRALAALGDAGAVLRRPPVAIRGGYVKYRWIEVRHSAIAAGDKACDIARDAVSLEPA